MHRVLRIPNRIFRYLRGYPINLVHRSRPGVSLANDLSNLPRRSISVC